MRKIPKFQKSKSESKKKPQAKRKSSKGMESGDQYELEFACANRKRVILHGKITNVKKKYLMYLNYNFFDTF